MGAGAGPARARLRAVLRFVGAVLAMSGALLLADVGVTLVWQEPISALLAARAQDALERQLRAESQPHVRRVGAPDAVGSRLALARAAREFEAQLHRGDAFGRIAMPTLDRSYVVA
jgi:hypothetical protein